MRAQRRRRLRLAVRDLAATSAFASMAISGELPAWVLGAFAVGLLAALLDRRVLSRFTLLTGVALVAGAASLYATVAAGGIDLVVAACSFAALLTLHRMLSPTAVPTDRQVLLTSLLMISGGAALSGELLFAVCLGAFAILASVAMALGVIEAALPPGADFSLRPVWPRLAFGIAFALAAAALFFVFIPRLSWNVAARRASHGLGPTTGLSDGVRLGTGSGTIKTNPRIVARVQLSPDPGAPSLGAYWVARTYGIWDGFEWTDGREPGRPVRLVTLRPGAENLIHQQVELLPAYGAPVAMALVEPVLIGNATAHVGSAYQRTAVVNVPGVEVRFEALAESYSYHAYSLRPDAVDAPAPLSDDDRQWYLTLPPLDPRISELAARVLQGERDPAGAARKVERYLKDNYAYTLELPDAPDDPLAHFLFERKAGHCEYYATALAVLLRTQGIPTRVATGFFGGERVADRYVLRAGDAHAWTQVWVPGRGFVNFDATPEAGRAAQPSAVGEWLVRQYEALDSWWRSTVLDYSFRDQAEAAFGVARVTRSAKLRLPGRPAFIVAGLAALLVYAVWRLRLVQRRRASPAEATRLRERAERVLAEAGVRAREGEGFEELSRRLERERSPFAEPVGRIARRYVEARFGDRPLRPGEAKALEIRLGAATRGHRPTVPARRAG